MKKPLLLVVGLLIVGTLFALTVSGRGPFASLISPKKPTIVFVTIDTLRADHVGAYGYPRQVTPFLDTLASKGVVFENDISASSHTAPSHTSLFTSLFPFQHGVKRNHESLSADTPTLYNALTMAGDDIGTFPSVRFLEGKVGFPITEVPGAHDDSNILRRFRYRNAKLVIDRLQQWLTGRQSSAPLFLWLHFYDVHQWAGRGNAPEKYFDRAKMMRDEEFASFLEDKHNISSDFFGSEEKMLDAMDGYDGRLLFVDEQLRRCKQILTKAGLAEGAVWIVTADHGEGLGNHNYEGHGEYLYNEQIHVPLIVSGLGHARRVRDLVRSVDITPTIAELVGVDFSTLQPGMMGVSFASLLHGENWSGPAPQWAFAERRPKDMESFRKSWEPGEVFAYQSLDSKLIHHSEAADQAFNLRGDPFELENLAPKQPKFLAPLESGLKEILSHATQLPAASEVEPDLTPDEVDELKTLGYM